MDPRGLVAFIVTFHEMAAVMALLAGALAFTVGLLVVRNKGRVARVAALAVAVGVFAVTLAGMSRLMHVTALDVEVVKVSD